MLFPDCSDELARLYRDDIAAILPDLEVVCGSPGEAGLAAAAQGRAGLMLLGTRVTAATLAALPELRVISFLSTGVGSWVDLDAAAARGVVVRSVRGYADRAVAEHALAWPSPPCVTSPMATGCSGGEAGRRARAANCKGGASR